MFNASASATQAEDNRMQVSDQGVGIGAGSSGQVVQSGAVGIKGNNKLNTGTLTTQKGKGNVSGIGNTALSTTKGNITITDAGGTQGLVDLANNVLAGAGQTISSLASTFASAQPATPTVVYSSPAAADTSSQESSDTPAWTIASILIQNAPFVALAIFVFFGYLLLFRKRS